MSLPVVLAETAIWPLSKGETLTFGKPCSQPSSEHPLKAFVFFFLLSVSPSCLFRDNTNTNTSHQTFICRLFFLPAEARVGCTDLVSKEVFPSTAAQALVWLLAAGCWGCVFVKQRSYL